jgi:hypothetical protein
MSFLKGLKIRAQAFFNAVRAAHMSISWLLSVQWVLQRVALGKRKMSRKSACARLSGELPYEGADYSGTDRILPGEGYFRYRRIILEGQKTYR